MSISTRILSKSARMPSRACVKILFSTSDVLSSRPSSILRALHSSSSQTTTQKHDGAGKRIHSSASKPHSAGAAAAHLFEPHASVSAAVTRPTKHQLKSLFVSSAIPMVGFGFMDNFIMIQAGGYIDATLGVQFGLATMTAAAMGQVFSDVSGVVFGGTVERFLERMKLIQPCNLTAAQRQLPVARNTTMAGAVLGVIAGCLLGATSLFFVDLEVHEREKHAVELQSVLTSMLAENTETSMHCEECTVHLASADCIPTAYEGDEGDKLQLKLLTESERNSLVTKCKHTKQIRVENESGDFRDTESLLCAPVISKDGKVLAVLEFKRNAKFNSDFTETDERTARILAYHIAIFMDRLQST